MVTIFSWMNRVGCSFRLGAGADCTLAIAGNSSKDKSEEETLLIVGVGGSDGRFSMAS
jgi:hypothetical protein